MTHTNPLRRGGTLQFNEDRHCNRIFCSAYKIVPLGICCVWIEEKD